jgi:hypothetical protein
VAYRLGIYFVLAMLWIGCSQREETVLVLPEHSPLAGDVRWGVVRVAYLRLRPSLEDTGQVTGILRIGEVVRIDQVRSVYQSREGFWRDFYQVVAIHTDPPIEGWISSDLVAVFLYEEAANRNSQRLSSTASSTS